MTLSIDQAIRKARGLPPEQAAPLLQDILDRFPANKRVRAELDGLSRPKIAPAPTEDLDRIVALLSTHRLKPALDLANDLLTRFAASEILHNITGAIHAALGHFEHAIARYDAAIELAPDYFEAWNNRGNALNADGRPAEAVASFDRAISLNPTYADAFTNRGIALKRLKRLDDALASASQSIRLNPRRAEAYNNRGDTLVSLNRHTDALADFDKAIALRPDYADALVNHGIVLKALNRLEQAVASHDRAISIAPAHSQAHRHRASALRDLKRLDEALDSYRRAVTVAPRSALAKSALRALKATMCLWSGIAELPSLGTGEDAVPAFSVLAFEDSPERQLQCARNWSAREYGITRPAEFRPHRVDGKIRIGYFSADFHNHATMYLMAGLLERHDRERFEIHAFSYGPDVQDEMRKRLLDTVDAFHPVGTISDEAVAALARSQSIDIAVDLKGHTRGTRSGIFVHRAAPVQVNYLGYPGTMGADFIDYIIADAVTIPADLQHFYSEKVAYLPNCYQPNDSRREISSKTFNRAELGLPEIGFVFCCFNNNYKITPTEFDIWARLLATVDGSVLWLLRDNDWAAANLRREAQTRGIAPDRLIFADRAPLVEHLARHAQADLFLDTFTVNAHTTASDALWAGLPVVTKLGSSFVARVAGSLLHALDMPELVTESAADYERLALELATDPAALAQVKAKLARNRLTSSLFDTERYTRDLEALYLRLHFEHTA